MNSQAEAQTRMPMAAASELARNAGRAAIALGAESVRAAADPR
jgi:hypothetical protein